MKVIVSKPLTILQSKASLARQSVVYTSSYYTIGLFLDEI